jgi:hypothetical protein
MSAHCSAALADSTTASAGLGFDTRSSVSRILGGEGCLGSGGLESPSTTTYELWVLGPLYYGVSIAGREFAFALPTRRNRQLRKQGW